MTDNTIVPIGKYKGQPLERLMADQQYSEWLLAQAWFTKAYADLAQLLRMGRLVEPHDTPEHNAMVAGLIDQRDSVEWLFGQVFGNKNRELWYTCPLHQTIEPKGGDILFRLAREILVEVKPLIGDDFPSVIRQIKAAISDKDASGVVIARRVETSNLTAVQVNRQFELAGVRLVLEHEFLNAAPSWRADREAFFIQALAEAESTISDLDLQISQVPDVPPSGDPHWPATNWEKQKLEDKRAKIVSRIEDLKRGQNPDA